MRDTRYESQIHKDLQVARTNKGWSKIGVAAVACLIALCIAAGGTAQLSEHSQNFQVRCNASPENIYLSSGPLEVRWVSTGGVSARLWISSEPTHGLIPAWNVTIVYYALGPSSGGALTLAEKSVNSGIYYIACLGVGSSPASSVIGAVA